MDKEKLRLITDQKEIEINTENMDLKEIMGCFFGVNTYKATPLKYRKYKKYEIPAFADGQWRFKFENNYGASVIKMWGSYGYREDKFELAVLYFDNDVDTEGHLCYTTSITDDVIGYLENKEVLELLEKIKNLE